MDSDYFVDFMYNPDIGLNEEQKKYLMNLEKIFENGKRDDFALLVNLYKLYKTTPNSTYCDKYMIAIKHLGSKKNKVLFIEYLGQKFGLDEKTIYNYIKIADRFISFLAGETYCIYELKDYTIAKLQELLPVSNDTIKQAFQSGELTYKSTRKQIRDWVKTQKGNTASSVIETAIDSPSEYLQVDDCYNVSITMPANIYEFCKNQVLVHKKYASLEDYLLFLIKKEM